MRQGLGEFHSPASQSLGLNLMDRATLEDGSPLNCTCEVLSGFGAQHQAGDLTLLVQVCTQLRSLNVKSTCPGLLAGECFRVPQFCRSECTYDMFDCRSAIHCVPLKLVLTD